MALIPHNISLPNDGLGDPLRTAFANQNTMNAELYESKVDKILGRDLSENNLTNALKEKLDNIAADAEKNVQADWNENDPDSDAFIKNKPAQYLSGGFSLVEKWYTEIDGVAVLNENQSIIEIGDLIKGKISETEYGKLLQCTEVDEDGNVTQYNIIDSSEIPILVI